MKALRDLLADRRRSQRGSVLSAVLIMVAFLAIISGALMTELSTNFLLSNDLLNRVQTEATVNSAAELTINQLQSASLNAVCPTPSQFSVNGQTAAVSYVSCAPTVDKNSKQFLSVASSSQFTTDGTRVPELNDYVVGDSGGTVFDFPYGSQKPRWTLDLEGSVTATPLVIPDPTNGGQFLDLIPASGSACAPASNCVSVRSDDGSGAKPAPKCVMTAIGLVQSQPASGGVNFPNIAFAGDAAGHLYTMDVTSGTCDNETPTLPTNGPVVAGPLVFPCNTGCDGRRTDDVFVLTSSGGSSQLQSFAYTSRQGFTPAGADLPLPWGNASGIAVENPTLPSRVAISFAGGQVAVVQIDANGNLSRTASVSLPAPIGGAPYWCHCPGSANLIGVGGDNGHLYVLDSSLNSYAMYAGSQAIRTTPAVDGAGDWYFGADNGRLYEVQKPPGGSAMVQVANLGSAGGAIGSSPVVGACQVGICVYLGSTDGNAYLVSLDARDAVLTSCISTAPPICSGVNPRLWTSVEIGVASNPQAVHVQGWSYYSP